MHAKTLLLFHASKEISYLCFDDLFQYFLLAEKNSHQNPVCRRQVLFHAPNRHRARSLRARKITHFLFPTRAPSERA